MLRVNHAGEYGAVRIYKAQLKGLRGNAHIQEMLEQEKQHLQRFNHLMVEHNVRPTVLQPVWHLAAYALGRVTAAMGEKAVHACTIAVETVIDDHYQKQLNDLDEIISHQDYGTDVDEKTLKIQETISACHRDELAHKQTAIDEGGEGAFAYRPLTKAIMGISKAAIWLSSRV